PLTMVVVIWAISGHVDPGAAALGLKTGFHGWRRGLSALALALSSFAFWRAGESHSQTRILIWSYLGIAGGVGFLFLADLGYSAAGAVGLIILCLLAAVKAGFGGFLAFPTALVVTTASAGLDTAICGLLLVVVLYFLRGRATTPKSQAMLFSLFMAGMIATCLTGALALSSRTT